MSRLKHVLITLGIAVSVAIGLMGLLKLICVGDGHDDNTPASPAGMLVPFYVWPDPKTYESMAAAGSSAIAVVTGPSSGPPAADDPNAALYQKVFRQLAQAGVRLIGYVHMSYGQRMQKQTLQDIQAWYDGFGDLIQGIFVDEAVSEATSSSQAYYAALLQAVKSHGNTQLLVFNPGTAMDAALAKQADIVIAFEDPWKAWKQEKPSSQRGRITSSADADTKTATLVLGTGKLSPAAVQAEMQRASRLGYSYAYFTDTNLPNPWDRLPSYWGSETAAASALLQQA